jgi:hypothetical protein
MSEGVDESCEEFRALGFVRGRVVGKNLHHDGLGIDQIKINRFVINVRKRLIVNFGAWINWKIFHNLIWQNEANEESLGIMNWLIWLG